jgi:hypothetical protein
MDAPEWSLVMRKQLGAIAGCLAGLAMGCSGGGGGGAEAGATADAPLGSDGRPTFDFCAGPASGALIDDMSGSRISLEPPPCGAKGSWYASTWPSDSSPGELTIPAGHPAFEASCGDLCQSLYSPLPAGFPFASPAGGDGGTPGPQAMCIAGHTGTAQYAGAGMVLELAFSGPGPVVDLDASDGLASSSPPALIDASAYGGIEFWLWVSPSTAASVGSNLLVQAVDKNQIPLAGVCDEWDSGVKACAAASAGLSGSAASTPRNAGPLLAADGSDLGRLAEGWQRVQVPWSSFLPYSGWGGANEDVVDPRSLAYLGFILTHDSLGAPAVDFDFCVYQLSFLPKSHLTASDGGA